MTDPVLTVSVSDEAKVWATLTLAFATDPVERWLYPEATDYTQHFPGFLAAFGGPAFDNDMVWQTADYGAVAVWLPPDAEDDGDVIVRSLTSTVAADKLPDTLAVLDQMVEAHPAYPHWYLPWLGVDPSLQGRGLGAELLDHGLALVDADHLPAYLETPNPRTVPLYERHGFETVGVAVAGRCPPITLMLRRAR